MTGFQFIQFDGPNDTSKAQKRRSVPAHVMKKFHDQRRAGRRLQFSQGYRRPHDAQASICDSAYGRHSERYSADHVYHTVRIRAEFAIEQCDDGMHRVHSGTDDDNDKMVIRSDLPSPKWTHRALTPVPYAHRFISQRRWSRSYHLTQSADVAQIEDGSAALSTTPRQSPFRTHWLPASMMHPMLFHASLFVCSASLETLAQVPISAMSYCHRGKAIQLINNGLSDPIQWKSDEIVAAVLCLANFECVIGNISALRNHLNGLLELAALRGGLDQFGMGGLLWSR
ncbi:hypothetical protein V1515DRAFT_589356 [Lipomyces mesembrius]